MPEFDYGYASTEGVCSYCGKPKRIVARDLCSPCYKVVREEELAAERLVSDPERERRILEYRRRYEAGEPILRPEDQARRFKKEK